MFERKGAVTMKGQPLTLAGDEVELAQKRWCGAAGIENVVTVSDYQEVRFGLTYGLLIKELRLLARAVMVVDKEGTIRYKELVREQTNEPDYEAAVSVVKRLL